MKLRTCLVAAIVLICFLFTGCGLPAMPSIEQQTADAHQLVDSVNSAKSALQELHTGLDQVKAAAAAATQPVVISPATPTQPAQTMPAPPAVVAAANEIIKGADKVQANIEASSKIADTLATSVTSAIQSMQEQNKTFLDKMVALTAAGQNATHAIAPGTPADQYSGIAFAVVSGLALLLQHRTANAAIVTPGTTLPKEGATPGLVSTALRDPDMPLPATSSSATSFKFPPPKA